MLAVRETTDQPCLGPSFPADMPRGQVRAPKEMVVYAAAKKPLQSSMNMQEPEFQQTQVQTVLKKGSRRKRGSGRGRGPPAPVGAKEASPALEVGLSSGPLTSSKSVAFARRPGFGQAGTRCIVKANHFLAQLTAKDLNHYDVWSLLICGGTDGMLLSLALLTLVLFLQVTITPEVKSRRLNRVIISELVKLHRETDLGMRLPAYDGRKSLYTAGLLPFSFKEFTVKISDDEHGTGVMRYTRLQSTAYPWRSSAGIAGLWRHPS